MNRPLRASYESGTAAEWLERRDDVLAVFEFGRSPLDASDPRHVPVALRPLDASPRLEVWRTSGPVRTGAWDGLNFAQGESLTMGHIAIPLRGKNGLRESSRLAYERLQSYLEQSPHPWALKIWNYIPGINHGTDDAEHYRQFCVGRAEAVSIDPAISPALPAATGIGTPLEEPALQVEHLAPAERAQLVSEMADEVLGLGPLQELLDDEEVSEIMVLDPETIYVERAGRIERTGLRFMDEESCRAAIERIVTPLGRRIDEISNDITGTTPASFGPALDYVVVKIPRFAFEKFPGAKPELTTAMKSVGEAMAIGRTIHESLQKALASMETGLTGFDEVEIEGRWPWQPQATPEAGAGSDKP